MMECFLWLLKSCLFGATGDLVLLGRMERALADATEACALWHTLRHSVAARRTAERTYEHWIWVSRTLDELGAGVAS